MWVGVLLLVLASVIAAGGNGGIFTRDDVVRMHNDALVLLLSNDPNAPLNPDELADLDAFIKSDDAFNLNWVGQNSGLTLGQIIDKYEHKENGVTPSGVDESCTLAGSTRQCGETDAGICQYGVQFCQNGLWGDCVNDVSAVAETLAADTCADDLDNDCDGFTDEDDDSCDAVCVPGIESLEADTCDDTLDNDCDALIDEADADCDEPDVCIPEVCDNSLDDDCDDLIDEADDDCEAVVCENGDERQCGTTDVGVCAFGIQACSNNQWNSCVGAVNPQTETCADGADEDCDGAVDEDCPTNGHPVVQFQGPPTGKGLLDAPVRFSINAYDPDGGSLHYKFEWGDGEITEYDDTVRETERSHTYRTMCAKTVRLTVTDDEGESEMKQLSLMITDTTNDAPTGLQITGPAEIATFGTPMSWTFSATDPEACPLTYKIYFQEIAGLNTQFPNTPSGTALPVSNVYDKPASLTTGYAVFTMKFVAEDILGIPATLQKEITVGKTQSADPGTPEVNLAPVFTDWVDPTFSPLVFVNDYTTPRPSWKFKITDPEGGRIKYAIAWGDGTSISAGGATGLLSGQLHTVYHGFSEAKMYEVTFTAFDMEGNSKEVKKSITVKNPQDVPSTKFSLGNKVRLQASGAMYADNSGQPGALVGYLGPANGTVAAGTPYYKPNAAGGVWYWKVNYPNQNNRWSLESQLTKIS